MITRPSSRWLWYGIALLGLATSLALLWILPTNAMPPVALGIILFVAWFGGLWPSMALLVVVVLVAVPKLSTTGDRFRMVAYAADAALVNLIIAWFRVSVPPAPMLRMMASSILPIPTERTIFCTARDPGEAGIFGRVSPERAHFRKTGRHRG